MIARPAPMLLALVLLASGAHAHESAGGPRVEGAWVPLDDPAEASFPTALRGLPAEAEQAYEAAGGDALLIARQLEGDLPVEAFMADEELVTAAAELVPLEERAFEAPGGEGLVFGCTLTRAETALSVTALYAPRAEHGLLALWLVERAGADFETSASTLEALVPRFASSVVPAHAPRYRTILLDHEVSFALTGGSGDSAFSLQPAPAPRAADLDVLEDELAKHPTFAGAAVRQWADPERGLELSFQVLRADVALGIKDPVVHHVAESLQNLLRPEPEEEGHVPIELLHVEDARTRVVSDEEVADHYARNQRAAEAGVILQVYLPRSPYARVARLRWQEGEGEAAEHVLALFVELRSYPRSRSETINRTTLAMFRGRARTAADLEALEEGLAFASRPLDRAPFWLDE